MYSKRKDIWKMARGLWLGVALALGAGAAQGQPLSGTDAALLQERMNSQEAKMESGFEAQRAERQAEHAEMRAEHTEMRAEHAEIRQEMAEGQLRLIMWVAGLNVALVMLVLAIIRRYDGPRRNADRSSRAYPTAPRHSPFPWRYQGRYLAQGPYRQKWVDKAAK